MDRAKEVLQHFWPHLEWVESVEPMLKLALHDDENGMYTKEIATDIVQRSAIVEANEIVYAHTRYGYIDVVGWKHRPNAREMEFQKQITLTLSMKKGLEARVAPKPQIIVSQFIAELKNLFPEVHWHNSKQFSADGSTPSGFMLSLTSDFICAHLTMIPCPLNDRLLERAIQVSFMNRNS